MEINDIDVDNFSKSSIKNIIIKLSNIKINTINNKISNVNKDDAKLLLKPKVKELNLIEKS